MHFADKPLSLRFIACPPSAGKSCQVSEVLSFSHEPFGEQAKALGKILLLLIKARLFPCLVPLDLEMYLPHWRIDQFPTFAAPQGGRPVTCLVPSLNLVCSWEGFGGAGRAHLGTRLPGAQVGVQQSGHLVLLCLQCNGQGAGALLRNIRVSGLWDTAGHPLPPYQPQGHPVSHCPG